MEAVSSQSTSQSDFCRAAKGDVVNEPGTLSEVIAGMNYYGVDGDICSTYPDESGVRSQIENGRPILTFRFKSQVVGHAFVISGVDTFDHYVEVMDPAIGSKVTYQFSDFMYGSGDVSGYIQNVHN